MDEPLIRDISDTARWMAVFRARDITTSSFEPILAKPVESV